MSSLRPGGALCVSAQKGREGLDIFHELLCAMLKESFWVLLKGTAFEMEVKEVTFQGEESVVRACPEPPEDFQIFIGRRQT